MDNILLGVVLLFLVFCVCVSYLGRCIRPENEAINPPLEIENNRDLEGQV